MDNILNYPIGSFEPEGYMLETLKSLIANEATRLHCIGEETSWELRNYWNSYRLAKEGYRA